MSTEAIGDSRVDLPLICGRLADTLSFMPTDLMDLSNAERAENTGATGKILTKEMMLDLAEKGITTHIGSTNSELQKSEIEAITPIGEYLEENKPNFNYRQIISDLASGDKDKLQIIQNQILDEVAKANLDRIGDNDNPIVAISDNLKLLRSAELCTRGNSEKSFDQMERGIPWGIREYEKRIFETNNRETEEGEFGEYLANVVSKKVLVII